MFSPNANGVGAEVGNPLIARTPLALRPTFCFFTGREDCRPVNK